MNRFNGLKEEPFIEKQFRFQLSSISVLFAADMISEHLTDWLGLPVELFNAERAQDGISNYSSKIYRLSLDWDAEMDFPALFSAFIDNPASRETKAIIIGQFHGDDPEKASEEVVQLLVSAKDRLPNLRGIFLGDIISEENEISWINQSDVSPLLSAYPNLEHLRVRGGNGLSFGGRVVHGNLKSLVIETGGLSRTILAEIASSQLPALEHLELWLGTEHYGWDGTIGDLAPFLRGGLFPKLKYLGLCDSEIVDQIAEALRNAPVIGQLDTLDLSMGTLSDVGGKALLENKSLQALKHINLRYHFLSKKMMSALKDTFRGINLDEPQGEQDSDDRFVAVGE